MSTIQMIINDEEVVCNKEFTIVEEFLNTSSTILENVYPKSWETDKNYTSRFYYPKDYSGFKLIRNGDLYFAGLVKNTADTSLNPRYPKYCNVQILDYKTLLSEGRTLDFVIVNKTVSEAIGQVIDAVSDYGFVVGTINITNDTEIGAYSTLDKTAYDVLQYLSEISQSRWTTRIIDADTIAVDFYDPELLPSAPDIQYTTEYFNNNKIVDMTWSYGTRSYRNQQYILSEQVFASIDTSENISANGYATAFITQQSIGIIKSIIIAGDEYTFATNIEKDQGIYADFYYTPGNNQFDSNTDNVTLPAGTVIQITYTALVQGRETVANESEISRIRGQIGRNGTIARYEVRNDITNSSDLQKVAQTYLKYKGTPEIILSITTEDVDLFNIGQQVFFDITGFEQLTTNYMVKIKETRIIQNNAGSTFTKIFYTYRLSSNFNAETEINFFDNQRRKSTGNIGQGQYITRNIDIPNTAVINFSDVQIVDTNTQGDNILDAILDCPLIN